MAKRMPMGILDKLAKSGKDDFRAETWADLDPGMKFYWIITVITLPFGILGTLIYLIGQFS